MVGALPEKHRESLNACIQALELLPHGPGLVGLVIIPPSDDARAVWLPTDEALEALAGIDRGRQWVEPLRNWPPGASPVVAVLPTTDAVLFAMLDGGGFGSMSAGGAA